LEFNLQGRVLSTNLSNDGERLLVEGRRKGGRKGERAGRNREGKREEGRKKGG
jgi:hypothetical protein